MCFRIEWVACKEAVVKEVVEFTSFQKTARHTINLPKLNPESISKRNEAVYVSLICPPRKQCNLNCPIKTDRSANTAFRYCPPYLQKKSGKNPNCPKVAKTLIAQTQRKKLWWLHETRCQISAPKYISPTTFHNNSLLRYLPTHYLQWYLPFDLSK